MKFPLACLAAFGFSLSILPAGSSIGLKFGADLIEMFPDEVCGVVPQGNWCNVSGTTGRMEGLSDAGGNKTTASVEWSSRGTWGKAKIDAAPTMKLLQSRLVGGVGGEPAKIYISDIPYASYTVYVYFSVANPDTTSTYVVNGTEFTVTPARFEELLNPAGQLDVRIPDPAQKGNYLMLPDQGGNLAIETSNRGWATSTSGDFRSPISAVQIVETDKTAK